MHILKIIFSVFFIFMMINDECIHLHLLFPMLFLVDSLPRAAGTEASNTHELPFVDGSYSAALPLPPLLKNVYGRGMPLLPYATATLVGNGSGSYHRKMSAGGSIPNPEAYMIQPTGTCVGITKREADHKTDYGTLEGSFILLSTIFIHAALCRSAFN